MPVYRFHPKFADKYNLLHKLQWLGPTRKGKKLDQNILVLSSVRVQSSKETEDGMWSLLHGAARSLHGVTLQ